MAGSAPLFWWNKPNWRAYMLAPIAWIYGRVAGRKLLSATPPKIPAPVLCIGNFTVGGAGKTPTAIAFSQAARKLGLQPGIVSRGYGGRYKGMHQVDPDRDSARYVGDEPLLLARHAPVVLCADRSKAAAYLAEQGCDFIIMDDGFQSARLHADFALLVVDSMRGVGNGYVIPAGPLRAPLTDQMRKTDALLRIGTGDAADFVVRQASRAGRPIYDAVLVPSSTVKIEGEKWLAFAGIGNPSKFFESLSEAGGEIVETRAFPDHYHYQARDIEELWQQARSHGLSLITTAKDYVRLATMPDLASHLIEDVAVLDIELEFKRKEALEVIIEMTREHYRSR